MYCLEGRGVPFTAKEELETHVDITHQQLIRGLVLLQGVVVDTAASQRAAEEEAEETICAFG
jgi:hypothetical protein